MGMDGQTSLATNPHTGEGNERDGLSPCLLLVWRERDVLVMLTVMVVMVFSYDSWLANITNLIILLKICGEKT